MAEETLLETPTLRWHHFDDPDDPELVVLSAQYNLHELALEDCSNRNHRAKLDDYGEYLFFIFNTLHFDEKQEILIIGKLCVFCGEDFVVTVAAGESRTVLATKAKLSGSNRFKKPPELIHALMDYVCDQFQPVLDEIADDIAELETAVYESPEQTTFKRCFAVKRVLISLRRVAAAHREIIAQLLRRQPPFADERLNLYFRDIYDHIVIALELIETNRDLTMGLIEITVSATAHKTNEIVKELTIYATILLPLNVITGFFGMNFTSMPLHDNPLAVPIVTIVMAASAVLLSHVLRRRNWWSK